MPCEVSDNARQMNRTRGAAFTLAEVGDRAARRAFVRLPQQLYKADPNWIPQLESERLAHYSQANPFSEHAVRSAWLAYRTDAAGPPVGRISAQIDHLSLERHGDATGYFGAFDCVDDEGVFAALAGAAEAWLAERGMQRVCGPFNLGINQEIGQLISGFDSPPRFMTPYGPRYAPAQIERLGYAKAVDLLAYRVPPDFAPPAAMTRLLERMGGRVRVRCLNRRRLQAELEVLREVFNDAWHDNWGFVPFTFREFQKIGRELALVLPDEYIQIAELDGEPMAFGVMLPDINEAIADLKGRLLPFGWAKLLWRLKVRHPSATRVPLMGVRRTHHNTRLGLVLAFAVCDPLRWAAHARGVKEIEMSWILEGNRGMRALAEAFGGEVGKRYRMYQKVL